MRARESESWSFDPPSVASSAASHTWRRKVKMTALRTDVFLLSLSALRLFHSFLRHRILMYPFCSTLAVTLGVTLSAIHLVSLIKIKTSFINLLSVLCCFANKQSVFVLVQGCQIEVASDIRGLLFSLFEFTL